MRTRMLIALSLVFALGVAVGRGLGPSADAREDEAANPFGEMLHVGIVVKDLDRAVEQWRAMGFDDIRVSPPNKGVDRRYHGKPIDVALKQAFIHGTKPMIELMEPVGDEPNPWGDYLKRHGESIHHLAYRVPDTRPVLEKFRKLGLDAIGQGKWPEGEANWGTFHYLQDPKGGVIVELISRIPRVGDGG